MAVANIMTLTHPSEICAGIDSAAPMTLIVAETVAAILGRYKPQLQAIVLTGSMARGEATFVKVPGGWDTLGRWLIG
jgi:hypothetical protein